MQLGALPNLRSRLCSEFWKRPLGGDKLNMGKGLPLSRAHIVLLESFQIPCNKSYGHVALHPAQLPDPIRSQRLPPQCCSPLTAIPGHGCPCKSGVSELGHNGMHTTSQWLPCLKLPVKHDKKGVLKNCVSRYSFLKLFY